MMNRTFKNIFLLFYLSIIINSSSIVFAEINKPDDLISRTVVEYKSGDLVDPFKKLIFKDAEKKDSNLDAVSAQPNTNFSSFKVQGIIWGGRIPQAIINNKVLTIGDLIDGAEILSIEKNGVTLISAGVIVKLTVLGRAVSPKQLNKEVPVAVVRRDSAE